PPPAGYGAGAPATPPAPSARRPRPPHVLPSTHSSFRRETHHAEKPPSLMPQRQRGFTRFPSVAGLVTPPSRRPCCCAAMCSLTRPFVAGLVATRRHRFDAARQRAFTRSWFR